MRRSLWAPFDGGRMSPGKAPRRSASARPGGFPAFSREGRGLPRAARRASRRRGGPSRPFTNATGRFGARRGGGSAPAIAGGWRRPAGRRGPRRRGRPRSPDRKAAAAGTPVCQRLGAACAAGAKPARRGPGMASRANAATGAGRAVAGAARADGCPRPCQGAGDGAPGVRPRSGPALPPARVPPACPPRISSRDGIPSRSGGGRPNQPARDGSGTATRVPGRTIVPAPSRPAGRCGPRRTASAPSGYSCPRTLALTKGARGRPGGGRGPGRRHPAALSLPTVRSSRTHGIPRHAPMASATNAEPACSGAVAGRLLRSATQASPGRRSASPTVPIPASSIPFGLSDCGA